jgi:5'-deoxynucleotidase YfbR-like HD superfamily hydrolase
MTWIQTYTGKKFDIFNPDINSICIEDIAHSLSLQCRFNGHCSEFYSVAEHCMLMSSYARSLEPRDKTFELMLLLHDASEAYLCDIPRPIKHSENFKTYRIIENQIQMLIYERFGLDTNQILQYENMVKEYDNRMLVTELRDLMACPPEEWTIAKEYEPFSEGIFPHNHNFVENAFLYTFDQVTNFKYLKEK